VLKVGLTVSASIRWRCSRGHDLPRFTRVFRTRRATILENNITQTAERGGEHRFRRPGVTMPALLILGYNLEMTQVILVSVCGLLGILLMIPLRRALIVKEAKTLVYPEGTACAEVAHLRRDRRYHGQDGVRRARLRRHLRARVTRRSASSRTRRRRSSAKDTRAAISNWKSARSSWASGTSLATRIALVMGAAASSPAWC